MSPRISDKNVADRGPGGGIEDLEADVAEVSKHRCAIRVDESLADQYPAVMLWTRIGARRVEQARGNKPRVIRRDEVETSLLDRQDAVGKEAIDLGCRGGEERVEHPTVEDDIECFKRGLKAHELQAPIRRAVSQETEVGHAAPKDEVAIVVCPTRSSL